MFSVSKMGSKATKTPKLVQAISDQLHGYLLDTTSEGIKFDVPEGEGPLLTVHTDAPFAPEGSNSHGAFIVSLGSTPVFWRSGKQPYLTLSSAEGGNDRSH